MDKKWHIIYWESKQADKPVYNFIESLELKAQTKIYNTFELLKEYGVRLGAPYVKKLAGTELWEVRILGADSVRIFYIAVKDQTFLMLHGFKKKTQKTPPKEILIAQDRVADYVSRKSS